MRPVLDEQGRRRYVAMEALSLGHGGVSAMSRISGLARSTIGRGIEDIRSGRCAPEGRVRKPGAGRKRKTEQDPTLLKDLKALVDPSTRGDPMGPLLWTTRSLRNLVKELSKLGHKVSRTVVGELLHDLGYSLQANSKTKEGSQHIDRDTQFQYINDQAVDFLKADEPVALGGYQKEGIGWRFQECRPGNGVVKVSRRSLMCTDFIDPKLARAVPYGVYDINNNLGWVSVGMDHDTASFAVNAIRRWWTSMGRKRHPDATRPDDLCRWRRQQRLLSRPSLEGRAAEARQRTEASHHGLPSAAWRQQMEQDRAPVVLVHLDKLAGQAAPQLPHHCPAHRRNHHRRRPQGPRRTR